MKLLECYKLENLKHMNYVIKTYLRKYILAGQFEFQRNSLMNGLMGNINDLLIVQ